MLDVRLIQEYLVLCKFRVVGLMLICAFVGMLLASNELQPMLMFNALLGIGFICAAGGICNQVFEVHIDALMSRTKNRPLLSQNISVKDATRVAILCAFVGTSILLYYVNTVTAYLSLAGVIGYALIYTCFLKASTPQNIVIGGLNGALPPLLGWTAITGHYSAEALVLVAIIYTWTPPHFWALAIHRREDYAKADVPMLPVTHGVKFTCQQIVLYTILMVIVTMFPVLLMMSGLIYALVAALLNILFLSSVWQLYHRPTNHNALSTFHLSIHYLMWLFVALMVDHFYLIPI